MRVMGRKLTGALNLSLRLLHLSLFGCELVDFFDSHL